MKTEKTALPQFFQARIKPVPIYMTTSYHHIGKFFYKIGIRPAPRHHWQMNQRLRGKRILITRPQPQAEQTARLIEARGAIPLYLPCLQVNCLPLDHQQIKAQVKEATDILFTSANGVHCLAETLGAEMAAIFAGKRIAAVGEKTADALACHDITADLLPASYSQEGLIELYQSEGMPKSLLFFRAKEGRELLNSALESAGCSVTMVPIYETICPQGEASEIITGIQDGSVDAVLLGSPKTALNYLQRIGDRSIANKPVIVAISRQVADTATAAGLEVQAVAKHASFEAMLDALASYHP